MPPTQEPTPPAMNGVSRLELDDIPLRHVRPMRWVFRTGIVLLVTGFIIVLWNLSKLMPSSATESWIKVGFILVAVSSFVIFSIPGALILINFPGWGAAAYGSESERRIVHPRLWGLAYIWARLVINGCVGAMPFVPGPFSSTGNWSNWSLKLAWGVVLIAAALVAEAPLLALRLFDRR